MNMLDNYTTVTSFQVPEGTQKNPKMTSAFKVTVKEAHYKNGTQTQRERTSGKAGWRSRCLHSKLAGLLRLWWVKESSKLFQVVGEMEQMPCGQRFHSTQSWWLLWSSGAEPPGMLGCK
jgi:hypothetical protein